MASLAAYSVGGRAEDLHQDVLVGARAFHGLPQLLHGVNHGRVQHGEDGLLKVSRQFFLQDVHQLLQSNTNTLHDGLTKWCCVFKIKSCTYVIILFKISIFYILTLNPAAVRQNIDDGLLIGS